MARKLVFVVAAVVLVIGVVLALSHHYLPAKEAMPALTPPLDDAAIIGMCHAADGQPEFIVYAQDQTNGEWTAYFLSTDRENLKMDPRAFAIVDFRTDALVVYADYDGDGRVDLKGDKTTPGLEKGPCPLGTKALAARNK